MVDTGVGAVCRRQSSSKPCRSRLLGTAMVQTPAASSIVIVGSGRHLLRLVGHNHRQRFAATSLRFSDQSKDSASTLVQRQKRSRPRFAWPTGLTGIDREPGAASRPNASPSGPSRRVQRSSEKQTSEPPLRVQKRLALRTQAFSHSAARRWHAREGDCLNVHYRRLLTEAV